MRTQSAQIYDLLHAERDYAGEVAWITQAVARYGRSGGNRLLDLACGTGRHLEYLQAHFAVEGLDLDQGMLAVAATRLPGVPLHEGDFTEFDLGRQYDVVLCLLGSIGYARWPENLTKAVRLMAQHTREGGVVVVEPWLPPEQTQAEVISARVVERDGLKVSRMRSARVEHGASILYFDYLVTTPDGVENFAEQHELGIFGHEQYLAAFAAAGLEISYERVGPSGLGAYIGVHSVQSG